MSTQSANIAINEKNNVENLSLSVMVRFQDPKYVKALNHIATEKKVNKSGPQARVMLEKQIDRWAKLNPALAKQFGFTNK